MIAVVVVAVVFCIVFRLVFVVVVHKRLVNFELSILQVVPPIKMASWMDRKAWVNSKEACPLIG